MEPEARHFRKEKPMKRFWNPISLALILLSLLWGAVPSFAQTANLVAFKASWTGVNAPTVVATEPAVVSQPTTLSGQSDLFGPFTGVALSTLHQGVDGNSLYA